MLNQAIAAAKGAKIVCIGDLMLDRYIYGDVARISPEAPVPVLAYDREVSMPGGAANVAMNAAAMGAEVSLIGVVGQDPSGAALEDMLKGAPAIESHITRRNSQPTTAKTRFVTGGQQVLRLDDEDVSPIQQSVEREIIKSLQEACRGAAGVMISDYAKGLITDAVAKAAIAEARNAGAWIIADPKGLDFARYGDVDLLKPNASELSAATGLQVSNNEEAETALRAAMEICPARAIVVTRAADGLSILTRGGDVEHVKGRRRAVFDVSGAGDTSLAAFALGLAGGAPLSDCAGLAVAASGVAVEKAGTSIVSRDELLDALAPEQRSSTIDWTEAKTRVADWRARGLRVGFSNGCFDILHRGHVALLEAARASCDRLIVGLNSDASVSRLKGADRPVNTADDRAAVLMGLASVDAVVVFEEDTPLELIQTLAPDLLVKGGDYAADAVVGAKEVKAGGGEVMIVPLVEGQSTTSQIERARTKP